MICFFFSSRRRHTRCLSDWSSDVCSSDLVDPLNRTTLRLVAAGWDLRDRRDSAQKYRDLAEGGLQVDVAISTFQQDSTGYSVTGVATNSGSTGSAVQRLTFEFLDAMGLVQVTQAIEIPPLPP